jgi:hypothetical protein
MFENSWLRPAVFFCCALRASFTQRLPHKYNVLVLIN